MHSYGSSEFRCQQYAGESPHVEGQSHPKGGLLVLVPPASVIEYEPGFGSPKNPCWPLIVVPDTRHLHSNECYRQ